ncbi:penicillin-binding protein 2 [Hippea jasoniae]|uniref:penicillin-binding protein 2 n=1 Tax=Hippea jasoniae TaxID=944479 RepID=UPI0005588AF0|nr:penicillin-binding protein 2 [Hippea jasoniae]
MSRRDKYILKSDRIKKNLQYIAIIITISFSILILRLFYLQVIKYNYFKTISKENIVRLIPLKPPRGDIITADGVFYAKNIPSYSVYLYKSRNLNTLSIKLIASILKIQPEEIEDKLKLVPYQTSILLKQAVDEKTVFKLLFNQKTSKFVNIEVSPRRFYPNNPFVYANIVGYLTQVSVNDLKNNPSLRVGELIGRKGIEKKYDAILRGKWGYKEIEVNSKGILSKVISTTPPKKGEDIKLTINSKLQNFCFNIFKDFSLKGAIVVLRPNGAILAIADSSTFNPNYFVEGLSKKQWEKLKKENKLNLYDIATQGAFPPGSLVKPFMALAALKEGIIKPDTKLFCPYAIKIGKYTYRDWKWRGFGNIDVTRAIESSSDVFFYQIGMKLGIGRIDYYLSKFGFGRSPQLFSYCTKGNLPSKAWKMAKFGQGWYIGDTISTAIGQGFFLASPLQVAVAFSEIANEGVAYKPFLNQNAKKTILYIFKNQYYKLIKNALWLVVNGPYGTASKAKINGLDICGKTGTSQVVTSKLYKETKKKLKEGKITLKKAIKYFPHAWFASFAPKDNPQVVVVVFLQHGEYSSKAAAIAKLVYEKLIELKLIKTTSPIKP